MEEAEVILGFLLPADEEATALIQPADRPFHDPPASRIALRFRWGLVVDGGDVWGVVVIDAGEVAVRVVVGFIEGEVLWEVQLGLGSLEDHRFDRLPEQLDVRTIGRGDHDRQRAAIGLDQEGALHTALGAIRRVRSGVRPLLRPVLRRYR